jgi:hypothetical protein
MSKPTNKSASFINPGGIIELHAEGPSTKTAATKNVENLIKLAEEIKAQGKPILILIDAEGITSTTKASRRTVLGGMMSIPHTKVAFYGPDPVIIMVNTLAKVVSKNDTICVFDNRADALKWLREK